VPTNHLMSRCMSKHITNLKSRFMSPSQLEAKKPGTGLSRKRKSPTDGRLGASSLVGGNL
jgi:hypothetical protein